MLHGCLWVAWVLAYTVRDRLGRRSRVPPSRTPLLVQVSDIKNPQYPLSSIIAAEWSSTKSRGRMMTAVFLMQAVGQFAAYGLGLAILVALGKNLRLSPDETKWEVAAPKIDVIWRVIIGVGAFPALVSLVLRRTIPETPYYLIETGRATDAVAVVGQVYAPDVLLQPTGQDGISPCRTILEGQREKRKKGKGSWWSNTREYTSEVKAHLAQNSRWRILLAVMLTWWLLDLAYCKLYALNLLPANLNKRMILTRGNLRG